jgi:non-ribosomal peptide synthetase component F
MHTTTLLHELISASAARNPDSAALTAGATTLSYQDLDAQVTGFASGLIELGLDRGERVGIFLDKRIETVVASFGTARTGGRRFRTGQSDPQGQSRSATSCVTATPGYWSPPPNACPSWPRPWITVMTCAR